MDKHVCMPIGITGRNRAGGVAGAGKDLFTKYIIENNPDLFIKYSFADPMRDIAKIFGFTQEQLLDPVLKEQTDAFWNITPRRFLQILGTDMFRDVWRKDVWIECARKFILDHPHQHVIIPDVRFQNEFEFIQANGGIVVQIVRDNAPTSVHVSELEVNRLIDEGKLKPDLVISNDGSEWDLNRKAGTFYLNVTTNGGN
jgi:hypothetical protein